jgi:hypothetical protein
LSGAITGAHQRIDRYAYKHVKKYDTDDKFPKIKEILHFEGKNGPDGIKAKSPAQDEPWHYFNPYDNDDKDILIFINDHYNRLVDSLKNGNKQRSAFEAAWLAHAVVDGLTPAHHYPYEQELEELRGESKDTRVTIKKKIIIPGTTKIEMIQNNWKMWGAKGLFTTHGTFELGAAMLLVGLNSKIIKLKDEDLEELSKNGLDNYFRSIAVKVADMEIYSKYYKTGWNTKLANQVRDDLIPTIIEVVSTLWCSAVIKAQGK